MTKDRIVQVLKNLKFTSKTLRIPAEIIPDTQFETAADQILLLIQKPNNDIHPQLQQHEVSGRSEQLICSCSEDEICGICHKSKGYQVIDGKLMKEN